jgi:DNA-binding CsgD family transcriptional regulator
VRLLLVPGLSAGFERLRRELSQGQETDTSSEAVSAETAQDIIAAMARTVPDLLFVNRDLMLPDGLGSADGEPVIVVAAAWVSTSAAGELLDGIRGGRPGPCPAALTERERGVIRLIALGYSNCEVARELGLSESTVKTHVSRMLGKLQLRRRTQLAVFARDIGVV